MLSKKIFTQEYISELRGRTGDDPLMIERTLFAFGLLEAIKSVDMPFVFKGGTALMLLLNIPRRFSTDIDKGTFHLPRHSTNRLMKSLNYHGLEE